MILVENKCEKHVENLIFIDGRAAIGYNYNKFKE